LEKGKRKRANTGAGEFLPYEFGSVRYWEDILMAKYKNGNVSLNNLEFNPI